MKNEKFEEVKHNLFNLYESQENVHNWFKDAKDLLTAICLYVEHIADKNNPGCTQIFIKLMQDVVTLETYVSGMSTDSAYNRRKKQANKVLSEKAGEYAKADDRLHNFRIQGHFTKNGIIENIIGNMAKHYASIHDMVIDNGKYEQRYIDEKFGDFFNYIILLYAAKYEKFFIEI